MGADRYWEERMYYRAMTDEEREDYISEMRMYNEQREQAEQHKRYIAFCRTIPRNHPLYTEEVRQALEEADHPKECNNGQKTRGHNYKPE